MFDGDLWQVTQMDGAAVVLERAGKKALRILISALLTSPGFHLLGEETDATEALGPLFDMLTPEEYRSLLDLEGHLREVRTGYRSGDARRSLPGEPQPEFHPRLPLASRYNAKATELAISVSTLRRRLHDYDDGGLAGLIDARTHPRRATFGRVDHRWVEIARDVVAEYVDVSQPLVKQVVARINARVRAQFGKEVPAPSLSTAQRVLAEVTRGQDTFEGRSSKQKRSIAGRPPTPYGRFPVDRIGQYLLLDTSPLDVFAMDPISLTWVNTQLTVAMDLATRCITGLRLSPVSAKAVDAAIVLYETIHPGSRSHTGGGLLPYGGVPREVVVGEGLSEGLPGVAPETIVIDHGRMYVSAHVKAVCERLGFSIQPARKYRPTDKAHVERFFLTLRRSLLSALPAYKGPDVYSRGDGTEGMAFYFADELESIIREWIVTCYHQTPHQGLKDASLPTVAFAPAEKWDLLTAHAGALRIPARPDLVYDFLPVAWRTIQHYGIEVNGLKYDGPGLNGYRNATSPYSRSDGKWPIRYDPDDGSRVFFQRPDDRQWFTLLWERAAEVDAPFSLDMLRQARRLALARGPRVDADQAIAELLERWDAGHVSGRAERRMALRRSEQRDALMRRASESADRSGSGSAVEREFAEALASRFAQSDDDLDDEILDDAEFYKTAMEVSE